MDEIERDLNYILQSRPKAKLKLFVHPFIEAYLNKGIYTKAWQWYFKHGVRVKVHPKPDFGLMEYRFYDKNDDEIRLD